MAREIGAEADTAHAAALLADSGHLILCQTFRMKAIAAFTSHRNLRGAALAERELQHFGIAHPTVGALWVDRLGFPAEVGEAITAHLREPSGDEATSAPLAALVCVGRAMAAAISDGEPADTFVARLDAQPGLPAPLRGALRASGFAERYARLAELPSIA